MLQPKTVDGPAPTMIDAFLPAPSAVQNAVLVILGSLLMALGAQIEIRLPFTPVPITGTTLGVLYAGALLGSRRAAASAALYLLEGSAGLPFFSGGAAGLAHLWGPTGGYLIGFVPAAYLTGALAERGWDRGFWRAWAMMLLGSAALFACGLLGLARFVAPGQLLAKGLLPFLPGDLIKGAASAGLLPLGWRFLGSRR
jgi:biotin transport system substrate-specific component